MHSNAVVAVFLVAVLLSGCQVIPSPTGPAARHSLPEEPTTLTERSVSNYTTAYEAATIYNRFADHAPTENRISCRSDIRVILDSAFVVNVQCTGGLTLKNGEHIDISASTHYYLSETTTERLDSDDIRSVRYREYQSDGPDLTSFEVVNLVNKSTSMSVELAGGDSESALNFDYDVDPHSGIVQVGVPVAYGTTREMRVETDDATTTAEFTSERIAFASPTVIYILPDGRVRVTVGPSAIR